MNGRLAGQDRAGQAVRAGQVRAGGWVGQACSVGQGRRAVQVRAGVQGMRAWRCKAGGRADGQAGQYRARQEVQESSEQGKANQAIQSTAWQVSAFQACRAGGQDNAGWLGRAGVQVRAG